MNLDRMLERCERDQWTVGDLDWGRKPRPMSRDDEMAIVQLFTDMSGIERLAGALFLEQQRRVENPTLRAIFGTFVKDEVRHSQAAQLLADYYDVHHYKIYSQSPTLTAFTPHFIDAVRYLSDDVANAYITMGELILDIALLRSINDYVHDEMSAEAMELINRDESRHIAIDYYMSEYYGSDEYEQKLTERHADRSMDMEVRAAWTFANMIYRAQPFIHDVFFVPMRLVDPQGKRFREAFKRMQLLGRRETKARRPFGKFLRFLQDGVNHPVAGQFVGDIFSRLAGVEKGFMKTLFNDDELIRVRRMTYDEMAQEALSAKTLD
jgi:hypothetical protein